MQPPRWSHVLCSAEQIQCTIAALLMRPCAAAPQHCRWHAAHPGCVPEIQHALCSYEWSELIGAPSLTAVAGKERSERNNKEESLSVQLSCVLKDNGEVGDHGDDVLTDAVRLLDRSAVVGAQFGGTTKIWISFKETFRQSTCKGTSDQTLNEIYPLDGPCMTLCADKI